MTNPQGRSYKTAKLYRGHVLRKKPVAHIKKNLFLPYMAENIDVYCVTTSTGYFLARTNGKPFVAKNCDALRYLCQNLFGNRGKLSASVMPMGGIPQALPHLTTYQPAWAAHMPDIYRTEKIVEPTEQNWLTHKIQELTGGQPESSGGSGRRGSFIFSIDE